MPKINLTLNQPDNLLINWLKKWKVYKMKTIRKNQIIKKVIKNINIINMINLKKKKKKKINQIKIRCSVIKRRNLV